MNTSLPELPDKGSTFQLKNEPKLTLISRFDGEEDFLLEGETLRFRYAKSVWKQGASGFSYREDFERIHNGNLGIVTREFTEPVDENQLELFRRLGHPDAVTGYFDHLQKRWLQCEPTNIKKCRASWEEAKSKVSINQWRELLNDRSDIAEDQDAAQAERLDYAAP